MLDHEKLYQLLLAREWAPLSDQLYEHRKLLTQDMVLQQVAQLFEAEYVSYLWTLSAAEQHTNTRSIYLLIMVRRDGFKESFWRQVVEIKLQAMYELEDAGLPAVASEWASEIPLARELLSRLLRERPEALADARRTAVNIKAAEAAPKPQPVQHVISIFKSPQERNFHLAMLATVSKMMPCPNLAMSVALDFKAIESKLSSKARQYFFNAQFDCVVVDPLLDYRPVHFFELDSTFHDSIDAAARDRLKDEICGAAGVKLLRVRAFEQKETTVEAFVQLIRELLVAPSRKSAAV